jgi:adenosylcobinamide-phosphate synthase
MTVSLSIISAYLLDLGFGDPEWLWHPVRAMGALIGFLENRLRGNGKKWPERIKGVILALAVVVISASVSYLCIKLARKMNLFLGILVWVYAAYSAISIKDLHNKARDVLKELKRNALSEARIQLSNIVGRDTQNLNEDKIITATIESIAESTNDGIIAPLFYLIIGGPVLAIAYKAINTLDSMVGYKNEKYAHFGWFSARLDDIANFIPARISGLLIAISSFILSKDSKNSLKVMGKDGNKHPSPNSGYPEAAMAGALGIKLGGPSTYKGRLCIKPYIGEDKGSLQLSLIEDALTLAFISSILMLSIGVGLRWVI